ncbi:hypothetical protein Lser_V15G30478 [Lactuca serriola]
MALYIDKFDRLGVVFPREKAIGLVLLSLPKSYDQFIENLRLPWRLEIVTMVV